MDFSEFSAITPAIVIVTFIVAELLKTLVFKNNDKGKSLLPVLCATLGILIATIVYNFWPDMVDYTNALDAITSGGVSGLAATGCNQLYKQLAKFKSTSDN